MSRSARPPPRSAHNAVAGGAVIQLISRSPVGEPSRDRIPHRQNRHSRLACNICPARDLDNLTDYNTNYEYVRHVLSMDTTFPGNGLLHRRVISPGLCQAVYALIILGEGLPG